MANDYRWPMRYRLTRAPFLLLVWYVLIPLSDIREWVRANLGTVVIAAVLFALGFWVGRR
jgi:hypothetical protein